MKVSVIGANGQLGSDVCEILATAGHDVHVCTHTMFDVRDINATRLHLEEVLPSIIVNTAAFHQVEKCEQAPQVSFEINALGAHNLAQIAADIDAYLIHISTDYVFDGKKHTPYVEYDLPYPLNTYGITKLAGEHYVLSLLEKSTVLRVSGLYGKHTCRAKGLNFVELMLKLGREREEVRVVDDERLSPTSTLEVARQILALCRDPVYGLCHGVAEGDCSWYEFAQEIFELAGIHTKLNVALPGEFPAKVPRPSYSVLENRVLIDNNRSTFKPWKDGLREYLSA